MISFIQRIAIGNALRVFIEPPDGATRWRVLRKGSDTFSGHDDASALVAYEGDLKSFVDSQSLQNDIMAFYRPYYFINGSWEEGATANATPVANYEDLTTDVLSMVRDRIEAGLKVECDRGNFSTELGYIQVYTAPPSVEQNLRFPLVTVHLTDEGPQERGIGEYIGGDEFDSDAFDWSDSEGWLAQVQLSIMGWSYNSDERIELRKALRRIVLANLPVFADSGFDQVNFSQQDVDAVNGEYGPPIYQVLCSFSCTAPVRVGSTVDAITDVEVRSTNG